LLSRLSFSQFCGFASGLIDGDGSSGNFGVSICNFDNNIKNMAELFKWNGVNVSRLKNWVIVSSKQENKIFLNSLSLFHSKKQVLYTFVDKKQNRASNRIRYFEYDDFYLVRIKSINELQIESHMADIMTEGSYFICNGVKVHNSSFFDLPYIIERIRTVLGKDYLRKICLWDQLPQKRMVVQFGREQLTYDLVGRTHLDYLELYKKHALQKKHSYRLDFIGEEEVGEKKIAYEGTLDQLFRKDFYKFIEYNRQDTDLLVKIDKKNKFIELANQIAHTNGVLLKTTLGPVGLIDQAIVNEAHLRGLIVHSRKAQNDYSNENTVVDDDDDDDSAAGAYVADPKVGMHENIGAVDINSLYPSTIRALNMCTETLVGQVLAEQTEALISSRIAGGASKSDAWHNVFGTLEFNAILERNEDFEICVEIGNINEVIQKRYMSAAEAHDFIFNSENLCISANGTIFRTDFEGIIPSLLTKWYKERQQMQKQKKWCEDIEKGIEISKSLEEKLKDL
jgi:DNA polymerase elongation subunit (family B)